MHATSRTHNHLQLQAIPRITSKGMVCGAVYRVASESTLAAEEGTPLRAENGADVKVL